MKASILIIKISFVLLISIGSAKTASAFEKCDQLPTRYFESFHESLNLQLSLGSLVKKHSLAKEIKIIDKLSDNDFFPYATVIKKRTVIVYPTKFAVAVCKLVIASYTSSQISLKQGVLDLGSWGKLAKVVKKCTDLKEPMLICFGRYEKAIVEIFGSQFSKLPVHMRENGYRAARSVQRIIGAHEFAHHLNIDSKRVAPRGPTARIDVEFEADFYAATWALQDGNTFVMSMTFFLNSVAFFVDEFGAHVKSSHYESVICRIDNFNRLSSTFGEGPSLLKKLVDGAIIPINQIPEAITLLKKTLLLLRAPVRLPSRPGCGKLQTDIIRESNQDLVRIISTMLEYQDEWGINETGLEGLYPPLSGKRTLEFLETLISTVRETKRMHSFATQILALAFQRAQKSAIPRNLEGLNEEVRKTIREYGTSRSYAQFLVALTHQRGFEISKTPIERLQIKQILFEALNYDISSVNAWSVLTVMSIQERQCDLVSERLGILMKFSNTGKGTGVMLAMMRQMLGKLRSSGTCVSTKKVPQ